MEEYIDKVIAIAKFKYDMEEEVTLSYIFEIEQCYEQNYTPIRTVEVVANHLFG